MAEMPGQKMEGGYQTAFLNFYLKIIQHLTNLSSISLGFWIGERLNPEILKSEKQPALAGLAGPLPQQQW